eukprot:g23188.t1
MQYDCQHLAGSRGGPWPLGINAQVCKVRFVTAAHEAPHERSLLARRRDGHGKCHLLPDRCIEMVFYQE